MRIGKSFWIFVAGGVIGAVALVFFFSVFEIIFMLRTPPPPKIAGHKVPAEQYDIDFSKRYNLILDADYDRREYSNCLIKGFTYDKSDSSRGYSYFDTWLVLELPDKRLVYLPPHSIDVIEEAKTSP